jgi:hypothetical protein
MEGATRPGWAFEYHNFYLDLYNIANPVLGERARSRNVGRLNFRAGHFYVPFGLNLQTDTHGTLLQLFNGDNFGFERDWYAGFWGAINRHLNYNAYYMASSGYDLAFRGQRGLTAVPLSLSTQHSSKYGLDGGISAITGERLWQPMPCGGGASTAAPPEPVPLKTQPIGIDARYSETISANGLALHFTPTPKEIEFATKSARSAGSRLSLMVLLKLFQTPHRSWAPGCDSGCGYRPLAYRFVARRNGGVGVQYSAAGWRRSAWRTALRRGGLSASSGAACAPATMTSIAARVMS